MFFPIKTTSLIYFIVQLFSISAVFASQIPSSNQTIDFYNDLTFIHKTLSESHPGVYNTLDPRFIEEMEKNFKVAKEKLFSADGIEQKVKIMHEFGDSFHDSHLWISYNFNINKAATPVTLRKTNLFGIQELQKNIYWVKIPTFKPSKGEVKVFQKIIKILPKLRKKTVIIDLRGNRGGNTLWGDKILEALFGKKYVRHQLEKPNNKVYSEWRVSQGNIEHIKECITGIKEQFGKNCTWIPRINDTYKGMKDALLRGEKYYINPADQAQLVLSSDAISSFKGRIVIIIDKYCGSASLIFIDRLKTMEADMVFVGESTGADSLYSELRRVPLPSGKGMLGFPIKIHRNRLRGNNVPYIPDIPYNSDLQNTVELQRFILDLLHKPYRY